MFMSVTPRSRYNFFIDDEAREGLRAVKERDGIPESEQIRRAIAEWLERRSVTTTTKKAAPRRPVRRRKA